MYRILYEDYVGEITVSLITGLVVQRYRINNSKCLRLVAGARFIERALAFVTRTELKLGATSKLEHKLNQKYLIAKECKATKYMNLELQSYSRQADLA